MPINVENEFKTRITATQAAAIRDDYDFAAPYRQTNTYYDTPDFALKANRSAGRIRTFSDRAEQTLKVLTATEPRHILEYTDVLSLEDAAELIKQGTLRLSGTLHAELQALGIDPTQVHPFTFATTTRRECQLDVGLLVLDETVFPDDFKDWELEMEYDQANLKAAQTFFDQLKETYAITPAPIDSKVSRATAHRQVSER